MKHLHKQVIAAYRVRGSKRRQRKDGGKREGGGEEEWKKKGGGRLAKQKSKRVHGGADPCICITVRTVRNMGVRLFPHLCSLHRILISRSSLKCIPITSRDDRASRTDTATLVTALWQDCGLALGVPQEKKKKRIDQCFSRQSSCACVARLPSFGRHPPRDPFPSFFLEGNSGVHEQGSLSRPCHQHTSRPDSPTAAHCIDLCCPATIRQSVLGTANRTKPTNYKSRV